MKYFSEAMLLTKQNHEDELRCWLNWHLNIIGFDHIVLFDNESPINVKEIISDYHNDKIEYHLIKGWPNQYKLYTDHVKKAHSHWSMALDDDEFLYVGNSYKYNVNCLIDSLSLNYTDINKFYVLWVNMFSKEYIKSKEDLYINTHTSYSYALCNRMKNVWREGNNWGKCIINSGEHEYLYSYGVNGHTPKCLNGKNKQLLVYGNRYMPIYRPYVYMPDYASINTDCFIAHYQFKTEDDWKYKCERGRCSITKNVLEGKEDLYKQAYSYTNLFKECDLLKYKWNEYIKQRDIS